MGERAGNVVCMGDDLGGGPLHPFDDPLVADTYEAWYTGAGVHAEELERRLLARLLARWTCVRTVLDVGCGTGHWTRWLNDAGPAVYGVDLSWAMLREAQRMGTRRCLQGDAHALPFPDKTFDLVTMVTTLEFVANPLRALEEAVRVARKGVILGVLNRLSLLAARRRFFGESLWETARFFSVRELENLACRAGGQRVRALAWRTTLWPIEAVPDLPLPWGGFIGMALSLDGSQEEEGIA
jgi:SAM-dependent methyltransferase